MIVNVLYFISNFKINHFFHVSQALETLHRRKAYKNILIYIEACLAGSMFEGGLPNNTGIYAMTASDSTHDAYYGEYDRKFDTLYSQGSLPASSKVR